MTMISLRLCNTKRTSRVSLPKSQYPSCHHRRPKEIKAKRNQSHEQEGAVSGFTIGDEANMIVSSLVWHRGQDAIAVSGGAMEKAVVPGM